MVLRRLDNAGPVPTLPGGVGPVPTLPAIYPSSNHMIPEAQSNAILGNRLGNSSCRPEPTKLIASSCDDITL